MLRDSGPKKDGQITGTLKSQKGSILLEFTFVITILMVVFLAAITFSFLFSDYYGIQKVAREGARESSITRDAGWAGEKARQAAWLWGIDPKKMMVDFSQDGTSVTCYVTYTSSPFHKTFPALVNGRPLQDVTMKARATFVWLEQR